MKELAEIKQLLDKLPEGQSQAAPNLFSISKYPHYEDVVSNWYAFFMDPAQPHELGTLFLDCLLQFGPGNNALNLEKEFYVRREHTTPSGKAIDLLISDGEEADKGNLHKATNAIVIENKVFHWLANELDDYWRAIDAPNKVGFVLSLTKTDTRSPHFKNVLHSELLARIRESSEVAAMPTRYKCYLEDLATNLHELAETMRYTPDLRFFVENAAAIDRAVRLREQFLKFVYQQLQVLAEQMNLSLGGHAELYRYLYNDDHERVYYTILLDDLVADGGSLTICVEVSRPSKDAIQTYDAICSDYMSQPGIVRLRKQHASFMHYASKRIAISPDEMENLAQIVLQGIEHDLTKIYGQLWHHFHA
ncbi:MAG TPA: PD-(D/E)XK nuclease family protein [Flavobacteriales bacterium]|nr:PD-(D/E)XK nuclease family protein [Flavobacteriales bacterium]